MIWQANAFWIVISDSTFGVDTTSLKGTWILTFPINTSLGQRTFIVTFAASCISKRKECQTKLS